jgi:hypothetical protein
LTSVLLNQLPLPDLPETLITSLVFLHRVHPITIKLDFDLVERKSFDHFRWLLIRWCLVCQLASFCHVQRAGSLTEPQNRRSDAAYLDYAAPLDCK